MAIRVNSRSALSFELPVPPNLGRRKPGPKPLSPETKFWAKVAKSDGCWLWIASRLPSGYGRFHPGVGVPKTLAHRFSYELNVGPIPPGLFVCHHCDEPCCVRPDHLFAGTASDNMVDMDRKGRHPRLRKELCKRGHKIGRVGARRRCRECHLMNFRRWYAKQKAK